MTRQEAMIKAREVFGEMGTISAFTDERDNWCLVWRIGEMDATVGRGRTWDAAFKNSAWRMEHNAKKGAKRV